jgi:hypothetical protein
MEPASPARLYATAVGALLVVLGIVGFFYGASFGSPGTVEAALGVLRVNAWLNLLYAAAGLLGLLLAGSAPRPYALVSGFLFTVLAIWGFAIGSGGAVLGFLPSNGANCALQLVLGLLGLAAAAGTPRRAKAKQPAGAKRRRLKPRAKLAGKGA